MATPTRKQEDATGIVNPSSIIGISAHKLQRKQRLEALVHQRISNFNYLQKIHEGGNFWLNIVLLNRSDIQQMVSNVPKQRAVIFYYLGLSIFAIMEQVKSGISTVRAFSQLLEEFEYFCSGAAMQGMKMLMAKNSTCVYPTLAQQQQHLQTAVDIIAEESSLIQKPVLNKFQNVVQYERLQIPPLELELDYVAVLSALCDALAHIYERLFAPECYNHSVVYDAILRLDGRVKHHVINVVTKEVSDFACKAVKIGTSKLRPGR